MSFALHPELQDKVRRLIVIDIAPSIGNISTEFRSYTNIMKDIQNKGVRSRKEADDMMREVVPVGSILQRVIKFSILLQDPAIRAFLLTNLLPINAYSPTAKFRVPIDTISNSISNIGRFPFEYGDAKWEGPALFIKGKHSK